MARTAQYLNDLFGVVAVKEPKDQDGGDLCGVFAHAGVLANAAQLFLGQNLVAKVNGPKTNLGRVVFDNRELFESVARIAPPVSQVKISQHGIEVTVEVRDLLEIEFVESELDKEVVQQVFSQYAIPLRHL
jgi:hypothetical protein